MITQESNTRITYFYVDTNGRIETRRYFLNQAGAFRVIDEGYTPAAHIRVCLWTASKPGLRVSEWDMLAFFVDLV